MTEGESVFGEWWVRRRGEPVFAFVDPDFSDEPFLVDRVPASAMGALLNALIQLTPTSDATVYVTDPHGSVFLLAAFDSTYDEDVWTAEAKRLAVAGGAMAIAAHSRNRTFRKRYGKASLS